jgi:tRNA G26 N,N-dimethylase Trm1
VAENAFGILSQNVRLFYGRIQLSPENADKVVLAACVLHHYLRNYVSVEDGVIENTDALSQFSYVTTFRRSGGSASKKPCV